MTDTAFDNPERDPLADLHDAFAIFINEWLKAIDMPVASTTATIEEGVAWIDVLTHDGRTFRATAAVMMQRTS